VSKGFGRSRPASADSSTGIWTASSFTRKPNAHPEIVDAPDQRGAPFKTYYLPERVIASTVGISNGAVHSYLSRARAAGLRLAAAGKAWR
jgi:hypothetical protein